MSVFAETSSLSVCAFQTWCQKTFHSTVLYVIYRSISSLPLFFMSSQTSGFSKAKQPIQRSKIWFNRVLSESADRSTNGHKENWKSICGRYVEHSLHFPFDLASPTACYSRKHTPFKTHLLWIHLSQAPYALPETKHSPPCWPESGSSWTVGTSTASIKELWSRAVGEGWGVAFLFPTLNMSTLAL